MFTPLRLNDALDGGNAGQPVAAAPTLQEFIGREEGVRITVDVGAWIARLTGTAHVGAGGTTFELNKDLAVGGMAPGVAGELAVWCDRWRFGGIGLAISESDTATAGQSGLFGTTALTQGDPIHGRFSAWMVGGEVGYTVWRPFGDQPWPWSDAGDNRTQATKAMGQNGRPIFDARFVVLGGGLALGYEQSVRNLLTGSSSEFSKTVGAVYGGGGAEFDIGLDGRVPLLQDIRLYAYAGVGPSIPDADVVWMVRVGVAAMLDPHIGLEFGYRLFDFDLQDGPSRVDGGIRGIFAALSLKF